jgi:hypothetical protein
MSAFTFQTNWADNTNSYEMLESGDYVAIVPDAGSPCINVHTAFYEVSMEEVENAKVF